MNAIEYKMLYDYHWNIDRSKASMYWGMIEPFHKHVFECNHRKFYGWVYEYTHKIQIIIRRNYQNKEYDIINQSRDNVFKYLENEYLEFLNECN